MCYLVDLLHESQLFYFRMFDRRQSLNSIKSLALRQLHSAEITSLLKIYSSIGQKQHIIVQLFPEFQLFGRQ